ncbi:hypothetical protein [Runella sp. SP2]|uniref:hypothetical protein n=1 Tax=Runella sp. SP2 TaxID=2268026 RepID=UPI0038F75AE3
MGFNPCSAGNCTGSAVASLLFSLSFHRFNPCSAGNCSGRRADDVGEAGADAIMFQSLFCWKLLWKLNFEWPSAFEIEVSILILLEIALEEYSYLALEMLVEAFQSLFCWKLLWKPWRAPLNDLSVLKFQSLFCWKLLWKSSAALMT